MCWCYINWKEIVSFFCEELNLVFEVNVFEFNVLCGVFGLFE